MAYIPVTTITECLTDSAKRKAVGTFAAMIDCSDVLLYFGVEAYRKSPTKKKAIMLYDTFCKNGSPYLVNAGAPLDAGGTIHVAIGQIITQRNEATQMGFFKRVTSSSSRVPPTTLFDAVQRGVNRQSMLDAGFLAQQYNPQKGIVPSMFTASGTKAKRELTKAFTDAGFSLGDVGLDP